MSKRESQQQSRSRKRPRAGASSGEGEAPVNGGEGRLSSSSALVVDDTAPDPSPPRASTTCAAAKAGAVAVDENAQARSGGVAARGAPAEERPFHDPIYRIMHRLPRSDILEVVKCKFGKEHCERAAAYFDASFMQNPLRRLKLQLGCSGPAGLHLFFPRVFFHRFALRTLDLSRNKLSADDVVTLCRGLALDGGSGDDNSSSGSSVSSAHTTSPLELLDLSYNLGIGSRGAVYLMNAIRHNTTIRAVQLVSVGVDDDGAEQIAPLLRQRPRPPTEADGTMASVGYTQGFAAVTERRPYTFLLNLNHNVIGAAGTHILGKGLPSYVSVTLAKQRLRGCDNPARVLGSKTRRRGSRGGKSKR